MSWSERSLGTAPPLVSDEPAKAIGSRVTTRCSATPIALATRAAASSSTRWRWPYLKLRACVTYPSALAMARQVAESIPPLRRTTACLGMAKNVRGERELQQRERTWVSGGGGV